VERDAKIGKHLADAGEQAGLVEGDKLKKALSVGMGRQEVDLGIDGKVAQPRRLAARLPEVVIESSAVHGLDPDYLEAMGFAWLAQRTLDGLPGNLPSVSGARGLRILGAIHLA